jgi:hypothetical protein
VNLILGLYGYEHEFYCKFSILIRPDPGCLMPVDDVGCPVIETYFSWTQLSGYCFTQSSDIS